MILIEAPPKFVRFGRASSFVPLLAAHAWVVPLASSSQLVALGLFFLKAGAFIFGSGLAIVPFLREGVVHDHHWLTERQFVDAVAMGLITPGPVVISATFIGYLVGGFAGAAVATVAIFIPIYLGVVIPGRWFIRHRDNAQVKAFVRGATAAAAGAIAGAVIVLARDAITDVSTGIITTVSLVLLWPRTSSSTSLPPTPPPPHRANPTPHAESERPKPTSARKARSIRRHPANR